MFRSYKLVFHTTHVRISAPLRLLYIDLSILPKLTLGGEKCFLPILNDYSRFTWIFLLKYKDQTYTTFLNFKTMTEKQFSSHVKAIQTNSGAQFKPLITKLETKGIIQRCTCPHISE